jgi:hypothetical protein
MSRKKMAALQYIALTAAPNGSSVTAVHVGQDGKAIVGAIAKKKKTKKNKLRCSPYHSHLEETRECFNV